MEYEKIKELIKDVENSKLTEINIEFSDGTKISMKKELEQGKVVTYENAVELSNTIMPNNKVEQNEEIKKQGNIVKSPMVGTFYIKSSPTSEPYVQVGKEVKQGDILCIIEAMKLMNEIESEFSGKVTEILVKDGEAVEYGTPLFIIN